MTCSTPPFRCVKKRRRLIERLVLEERGFCGDVSSNAVKNSFASALRFRRRTLGVELTGSGDGKRRWPPWVPFLEAGSTFSTGNAVSSGEDSLSERSGVTWSGSGSSLPRSEEWAESTGLGVNSLMGPGVLDRLVFINGAGRLFNRFDIRLENPSRIMELLIWVVAGVIPLS